MRAIVRSAERASNLPEGVTASIADSNDLDSLKASFRGAAVVHFIPPLFNPLEEAHAANAMRASAECDVSRFVYHSVLHADTPQMPHHVRKARVERALRDSELRWTVVQPAMYVSTPLLYFDAERGKFRPPFNPQRKFSPVDLLDLSEAVANILCDRGHEFATYELAGAERLDFFGMASVVSAVTGRQVGAEVGEPEIALRVRSYSAHMQTEARAMYAYYDAHGLPGNGNVLRLILGREPATFEASMRSHFENAYQQ